MIFNILANGLAAATSIYAGGQQANAIKKAGQIQQGGINDRNAQIKQAQQANEVAGDEALAAENEGNRAAREYYADGSIAARSSLQDSSAAARVALAEGVDRETALLRPYIEEGDNARSFVNSFLGLPQTAPTVVQQSKAAAAPTATPGAIRRNVTTRQMVQQRNYDVNYDVAQRNYDEMGAPQVEGYIDPSDYYGLLEKAVIDRNIGATRQDYAYWRAKPGMDRLFPTYESWLDSIMQQDGHPVRQYLAAVIDDQNRRQAAADEAFRAQARAEDEAATGANRSAAEARATQWRTEDEAEQARLDEIYRAEQAKYDADYDAAVAAAGGPMATTPPPPGAAPQMSEAEVRQKAQEAYEQSPWAINAREGAEAARKKSTDIALSNAGANYSFNSGRTARGIYELAQESENAAFREGFTPYFANLQSTAERGYQAAGTAGRSGVTYGQNLANLETGFGRDLADVETGYGRDQADRETGHATRTGDIATGTASRASGIITDNGADEAAQNYIDATGARNAGINSALYYAGKAADGVGANMKTVKFKGSVFEKLPQLETPKTNQRSASSVYAGG